MRSSTMPSKLSGGPPRSEKTVNSGDQRKAITARSGGSSGARSSSIPCGKQVMLRLRPSAWVSSSS
jgi:hypothetical protein